MHLPPPNGNLSNGEPVAGTHRAIQPTVDHRAARQSCGTGRSASTGASCAAVRLHRLQMNLRSRTGGLCSKVSDILKE